MALVNSSCAVCGRKVEILDTVLDVVLLMGKKPVCYLHTKSNLLDYKELDKELAGKSGGQDERDE